MHKRDVAPFTRISLWLSLALLALWFDSSPAFAQMHRLNAFPGIAGSSTYAPLPKGVQVVGCVPLPGEPVTRMYTQWEYGRTYLYIEHSGQPLTTVDVTHKRNPGVVSHAPAALTPEQYEELAEGGTVQTSPLWNVNAGVDNGRQSTLAALQNSSPGDAMLFEAFGPNYSNLADRDQRLIYMASPTQLLILADKRFKGMDVY